MNTKTQVRLDKYIAKPFGYVLNLFVRLAGQIFSIDHNLDKDFKSVTVCKFKGMGSIIQATPLLYSLRKRYPNAEIIFVSTEANRILLKKIDLIDTVVLLNDKSFFQLLKSFCKSLLQLIRKRVDVYIDLEIYSGFSTIFSAFTFAKNRIGFYLSSDSFRVGIYTHMMFFNSRVPISKAYLQIASLLGGDTENIELYPLNKKENSVKYLSTDYIVINPNASDLRIERRWGEQNFIELIKLILKEFPSYEVILIGGKGEREYTEQISSSINNSKVKNLAEKTSLDELISIISNSKLMISNDTGPMHIAFSTNTPVVCLFGPCSPEQYGISKNAFIIYKQVYCSPCVHEFIAPPCKGNNLCMKLIEPKQVLNAVKKMINESSLPALVESKSIYYKKDDLTIGLVKRS